MAFPMSGGFLPPRSTSSRAREWEQHRFELKDFDGCDGSGLMGVFFGGRPRDGPVRAADR